MTEGTKGTDVLVVGAGPVGLALACELRRHGLACRVIDQLAEPVVYSKAQIVHARTLEALESLDLAAALVARGRPLNAFAFYTPALKRVARLPIEGLDSPYDYVLSISQHDTERVLTARLAELGVAIERAVRLASFDQDPDGVTATLAHPDGATEALRVPWLVGCDGAHSTVRKALGLPFEGSTYEQRVVQADVRIDWPYPHNDDEVTAFVGDRGVVGTFPLPEPGRYRMLTFVDPAAETEVALATFQALMDERGPKGATVRDPAWMVDFRFHCRMVPRYREGRVFLAGDAAHIHSPAGGQGMNLGIQDAMNLGWKLALVHRGAARPAVLDAYDAERRPIAAATLRGTDSATRGSAFVLGMRNTLAVELRNQFLGLVTGTDVVQERAGRLLSMLETAYPESPIVAQDRPSAWTVPVGAGRGEAPGLRDWLGFGDGPAPGARAVDARLPDGPDGTRRLQGVFRGTRHTLLLFDGAAATAEGYANLDRVARDVRERYDRVVDVHVVVPRDARPAALAWDGSVLLDPAGEAHRRYGARAECLYLVRPDGYVAYRCQPADGDALGRYLASVFT